MSGCFLNNMKVFSGVWGKGLMISMSTKKFPLDEAGCGVYIPSQNRQIWSS